MNPGWRKRDADNILCIGGSTEPRMNLEDMKLLRISEKRSGTHCRRTAPRTSSVRMTVVRWYAITDHAS